MPAKEPVTFALPPGFGNVNPKAPEGLELNPYSEKVTTLGRILAGVQIALTVSGLTLRIPLQALDALEIVVVALPFATLATFDPDGVHPSALKTTVVDSALFPFAVSGGENLNAPVTRVQVMLPVAIVPRVELEPELHPVANITIRASAVSNTDIPSPRTDITPPWQAS